MEVLTLLFAILSLYFYTQYRTMLDWKNYYSSLCDSKEKDYIELLKTISKDNTRDSRKQIKLKTIDNDYNDVSKWIGKKVMKKSLKPFKTKKKVGTVTGLKPNNNSKKMGFIIDGSSVVDCDKLILI